MVPESEKINGEGVKKRIEGILGEVGSYLVASECQAIGVRWSALEDTDVARLETSLVSTLSDVFGHKYAAQVVNKCFHPRKP